MIDNGGDIGGQQGFPGPGGLPPGMFPPIPPPELHHHRPEPFPPPPGRRLYGVRAYRPPVGSPGWVALWVVRLGLLSLMLAVLGFIVYIAFQVFHGPTITP